MPAYTSTVNQTDGTKAVFGRRERPKLLIGEGGRPEVLYTGVCPSKGAGAGGSDLCYTHAQPVRH